MDRELRPEEERMMPRRLRPVILTVVGLAVVVGGFFLGRDLWWSLRPTPNFASLVDNPDASLRGTVAYLQPYPDDDCIYVVAASGGPSEKVACVGHPGSDLVWLPDGRLQATGYGNAQEPERWRMIVNIETRAIENVPSAEIPPQAEPRTDAVGPNGEIVTSSSRRGRLTVTLTTDQGTRSLLSVGAPTTYTFGLPVWNPEGGWFVVKDDLDRLLVVTITEPSQTRVLVQGGWGQAITSREHVSSTG
jgi:hypothetical protein